MIYKLGYQVTVLLQVNNYFG